MRMNKLIFAEMPLKMKSKICIIVPKLVTNIYVNVARLQIF